MSYFRYFCLFMQSGAQHLLCCVCFVCLRIVYPLLMLTRKLLNQGFLLAKSKSSPRTFYVRHHDLVDRYGISVSQMTTDMFHFFNQINTTGASSGAGTAYPSGARDFTPGFQWGSCYSFCSFMCMLFVLFLLAIVLSVLLRYTDFHYPFGIFKLLLPLSLDCPFLIASAVFFCCIL